LSSKQQPLAWSNWVKFFLKAITEQAKINLSSARQIIDLYERSKAEIISITRSQHAVPLLDILFERPVFSPAQLEGRSGLPSKQMIMSMLARLKDAGILIVTRESSGRRPQILAFRELVNLCEGHEVVRMSRIKRARVKR
jgi:cell filamentation protein, protein adenylyltransferase